MEESAGGARRATKSKLFEFLVHGVRPGMPSGARMPHQGAPMGPPGPPYGASPAVRPGLPAPVIEASRKRPAPSQQVQQQAAQNRTRKKPIRELVPESQAYMDLLAFERKLDQTIMRKRVDIQEALKRPMKWHRTPTTQETDGFQVKRPGDPPQFKLDPRLARLLGIHTQTRSCIIQALWQYRLTNLLLPPDPIVINHVISVDPNDQKKTACYDIDVEVEDPLKSQMSSFLLSTANQQEIASLDNKLMTDVVGNPEEERRAEFYHEPWSQEAVSRYFYCKIQQRRQELEQALAVRNT
ncbi:hypothetical protein CRUP_029827 [Coryphaenoides rupestris]|nr:hypothetical protein CRUP_029827 [Coryphaenoides rupestris]